MNWLPCYCGRLRSLKRELKEKETELKEKRKKKAELESRKNSKPKRLGRLKYPFFLTNLKLLDCVKRKFSLKVINWIKMVAWKASLTLIKIWRPKIRFPAQWRIIRISKRIEGIWNNILTLQEYTSYTPVFDDLHLFSNSIFRQLLGVSVVWLRKMMLNWNLTDILLIFIVVIIYIRCLVWPF